LSVDIAAAHRALSRGEWKAATVLAGSVIEALCLWIIRREVAGAAVETARRLQREGLLGARGVGLIRFSGHLSYGGYDVQTDGRHTEAPRAAAVH
jgi:hypothetical protein